jgi:hypothetical protein
MDEKVRFPNGLQGPGQTTYIFTIPSVAINFNRGNPFSQEICRILMELFKILCLQIIGTFVLTTYVDLTYIHSVA